MDVDEELARLIGGAEPPEWLAPAIGKMRATLAWRIGRDGEPREDVRAKLARFVEAVDLIRDGLAQDFELSTILLKEGDGFIYPNETYHGLGGLRARAIRAMGEIREGPGRDKHYLGDGLPPRAAGALMVCVLWNRVHGMWPAKTNANVHDLCQKFWVAAGGGTGEQWGRGSLTSWRDHLRDAYDVKDADEAGFIERSIERLIGGGSAAPGG